MIAPLLHPVQLAYEKPAFHMRPEALCCEPQPYDSTSGGDVF